MYYFIPHKSKTKYNDSSDVPVGGFALKRKFIDSNGKILGESFSLSANMMLIMQVNISKISEYLH